MREKESPFHLKLAKFERDFPLCSKVIYKAFFFLLQLFGEWDGKETDN